MYSLHRLLSLFTLTLTSTMSAASSLIFIGTYTPKDGASKGIYAVRLDETTGALSAPVVAAETPAPTFLAWRVDHKILFALGEGPAPDGKITGGVAAFSFDAASGKLTPLNSRGTGGGGTTHLAPDATGRMLITRQLWGGLCRGLPARRRRPHRRAHGFFPAGGPARAEQGAAGKLAPALRHDFTRQSLRLRRRPRPRPRLSYKLDPAKATLTPNDPAFIATAPGSGPRHTKFSLDGRFFYILDEVDGTVTTCAYDAVRGSATPIQVISTLPAGFKITDPDRAAEIRVHPNGKFIYTSNRGALDSLAVFAVNADGTLKLVEIVPCGGAHPRNFNLSPDGRWLVCANMNSNSLTVFKVDPATGRLTATGAPLTVPQPVCVLFAP